jgi:hypothetical protein
LNQRPLSLHALLFGQPTAAMRLALAAALYLGMVIGGSIPGVRADMAQVASGFILHSCAYGVLSFLLFTGSAGERLRRGVVAVMAVVVLGALDEFIQSFFPYRRAAVSDWLVDCSAALVVALLLWGCWPRLAKTA